MEAASFYYKPLSARGREGFVKDIADSPTTTALKRGGNAQLKELYFP